MDSVKEYRKRVDSLTERGYAGRITQGEYDERISIERSRVLLIIQNWKDHPEFGGDYLTRQAEDLLEILRRQ